MKPKKRKALKTPRSPYRLPEKKAQPGTSTDGSDPRKRKSRLFGLKMDRLLLRWISLWPIQKGLRLP